MGDKNWWWLLQVTATVVAGAPELRGGGGPGVVRGLGKNGVEATSYQGNWPPPRVLGLTVGWVVQFLQTQQHRCFFAPAVRNSDFSVPLIATSYSRLRASHGPDAPVGRARVRIHVGALSQTPHFRPCGSTGNRDTLST